MSSLPFDYVALTQAIENLPAEERGRIRSIADEWLALCERAYDLSREIQRAAGELSETQALIAQLEHAFGVWALTHLDGGTCQRVW